MTGVVVDSSVLMTWFTSPVEVLVNACRKELAKNINELYSHSLLRYEVSNALVHTVKAKDLVNGFYSKFESLPITYKDLNSNEYELARDIALKVGDSVYDSSYHALAITKGLEFVTCDRKYYKKAKKFGFISLIS